MKNQWEAIVFHSSLKGGKMSCKVFLEGSSLKIRDPNNREFGLDIGKVKIYWGGTSGSLLCIDPMYPETEPRLSVRDRSILKTLRLKSPGSPLAKEIDGLLKKVRRKLAWMLGSFVSFCLMLALFLVLFLAYGVGWVTDIVPYSVDKQIGQSTFEPAIRQITGSAKYNQSPVVNRAIGEMVDRLTGALEKNPFTYEVRVVNSPITNAFALPGGKVAVLTGLIEKAELPEEVAGVLAHEISHVSRRHGIRMMIQRVGLMLMIKALLGDSSSLSQTIVDNSAKLIGLKFGRDMERDADHYGFLLMKRARVNPQGLKTFFARLQKLEKKRAFSLPSWISTHPVTAERVKNIDGWMKKLDKNFRSKPFKTDWQEVKKALK